MTKRNKRKAQDTDEGAPAGRAVGYVERVLGGNCDEALRQRLAPAGREKAWPTHAILFDRLFTYVVGCITPKRMAEMRRGHGDAAASPRDYDCHCPVPKADALPDCVPHRAECRFRHRMRLRPKVYDNKFAHTLAREMWDDLLDRWPQIPVGEQNAMIEKAIAFYQAERKREARREADPAPEPAPLMENWRWCDLR